MGLLGTSIFCLPIIIGGTEGPLPFRTGVVVLGGIPTVLLSLGIVPITSFQFTTGGYFRTPTALCVAPDTISLWITARNVCKALPLVKTPSAVIWLTSGMTTGTIAGIYRFVNIFCGKFTLIVSALVIFLFFLSLV